MHFGAAYYAEYRPRECWESGGRLMQAALERKLHAERKFCATSGDIA